MNRDPTSTFRCSSGFCAGATLGGTNFPIITRQVTSRGCTRDSSFPYVIGPVQNENDRNIIEYTNRTRLRGTILSRVTSGGCNGHLVIRRCLPKGRVAITIFPGNGTLPIIRQCGRGGNVTPCGNSIPIRTGDHTISVIALRLRGVAGTYRSTIGFLNVGKLIQVSYHTSTDNSCGVFSFGVGPGVATNNEPNQRGRGDLIVVTTRGLNVACFSLLSHVVRFE